MWHIGRCNWSHVIVYILKMAIVLHHVLHDKFDSWQEFQDKLDAYCKETYQSFVKDDSKTVESVNKHRKEPFILTKANWSSAGKGSFRCLLTDPTVLLSSFTKLW